MDNLHLLIVIILLSFGTGHAIFRSKFGFITLAFLSLFIYFIYFQIQGAQWSVIAITAFISGIAYAYRESSEDMIGDWLYRIREVFASINSNILFKKQVKNSQTDNKTGSYQQEYEEEKVRREQEAKVRREHQERQGKQQEETQFKQKKAKRQQSQSNNHREQKESIEKKESYIDSRTNIEILGLTLGFTQEELKKAYRHKTMKTHPDKWGQEPSHIQKVMEEEFKLIKEAYYNLKE